MKSIPQEKDLVKRCRICNFPVVIRKGIPSNPEHWGASRGITPTGSYNSEATPTPEAFNTELYESDTISFSAATATAPAKILDSEKKFVGKLFRPGETIVISHTDGSNNGTYTLAELGGVTSGELSLATGFDLTTQSAAIAGTVTISVRGFKPNVTTGCPFCGSLNSH